LDDDGINASVIATHPPRGRDGEATNRRGDEAASATEDGSCATDYPRSIICDRWPATKRLRPID
jgi:hypothetical protein